ncbi:MAG: hypothetical protein CR982_00720 [Candidatus Cloacimonadota bacterium]|nr:MAG: hypothetical protein CR982_00720 [Candidatus Cloacimonadota bacterium]PIE79759.1 MAG: hypothetical protein CSA15_02625 [Candidatus Delongbacteria bacterium]
MFNTNKRTRKFSYYTPPKKDKTSTIAERIKIQPLVKRDRRKEKLRYKVFIVLFLASLWIIGYFSNYSNEEVVIEKSEFEVIE